MASRTRLSLKAGTRSWFSSKVSTRVLGMVISVQQGASLEAGKVGRRHRRDEIDIAGEQRRHPRRRLLDRREHDLIDIAGRVLVPIIGEALELEPHALLALGDDERAGAAGMASRRRTRRA